MRPLRAIASGMTLAVLLAPPFPPNAAWAGYEFPLVATEKAEVSPAISGDLLVWAQSGVPWGYQIWGRDLITGIDFPISSVAANSIMPDTDGGMVAWLVGYWTGPTGQGLDVYGKDLASGNEFAACTAPGSQGNVVASSGFIAWTDARCQAIDPAGAGWDDDVYGYDLLRAEEVPVAVGTERSAYHPSISGDRMVWIDTGYSSKIHGARLVRDAPDDHLLFEEFPVPASSSPKTSSVISGDIVVWLDYWEGVDSRADVRGLDLRTGREFAVSTAPGMAPQDYTEVGLDISGNIVVWEDWRNNPGGPREPPFNMDIYGYDLSTGEEFAVCTAPDVQMRPRVSGNLIVWEDYRNSPRTGDVYGYQLNASLTPSGTAVATSVLGTTVVFESVTEGGVTTVDGLAEPHVPEPIGFQVIGSYYEITTTAHTTGTVTVKRHYQDGDIPGGQEEDLALLWWEGGRWVDITTRPIDVISNIVTGECASLSLFVLAIPAQIFSDVGSDFWAHDEIEACAMAGIVQGYGSGTYRPTLPVTRDQMAVYISRALAGGDGGVQVPSGVTEPTFADVDESHWAYRYIEYCADADIVQGYPGGGYHPDEVVNRAQMAVYIARAEAGGDDAVPPDTDGATFTDVLETGDWSWAYRYVEYCATNGIVRGYLDGTYRPGNEVTRDQMAVYVARAFQLPL